MNNLCFEQEKLLCNEPYQVKCYYFRFAQGLVDVCPMD